MRAEGAGRAQKAATLPVWCKAGDESIQVTFLRGREKPLSQANFSDLKLWAEARPAPPLLPPPLGERLQ